MQIRDSTILVTATGFLGTHLINELNRLGAKRVIVPFRENKIGKVDLTDKTDVRVMFENCRNNNATIDYVFHNAGYNGGIFFNQKNQFDIFSRNTQMAMNVLEACKEFEVKKVVSVVASCAYPEFEFEQLEDTDTFGEHHQLKFNREVMREKDFFEGPIHQSVACHGYAKRNLQLASSFAKKQYGLNAVCVCPTTLFGPGDSFDAERTKVLGAMVKRFVDAKRDEQGKVVCWGTGSPMREFLYVEDCAKLLVECLLKYNDSDIPLNLGTGQEYSIKQVAEIVAKKVEYKGKIKWDTTKPDGQFRKRLDLTRMENVLGKTRFTPFEEGVAKTVDHYWRFDENVF
jgi:nucleoside-diphosphate-sugar epimerase